MIFVQICNSSAKMLLVIATNVVLPSLFVMFIWIIHFGHPSFTKQHFCL